MSEPSKINPARKAATDAYASAIRAVLDASPGNQKELAVFSETCTSKDPKLKSFSEAAISRYLSGRRVADSVFLEVLEYFLESIGKPMLPGERRYLHRLREEAQAVQPDSVASLLDRIRLLEVERASIENQLCQQKTVKEIYRQAFDHFNRKAQGIEEELRLAREQLYSAAAARFEFQERVDRQTCQLEYAAIYSRQLEKEVANSQERSRLLHREVGVLREQVRRLHEETTFGPSGRAAVDAGTCGDDHARVAVDHVVPRFESDSPLSGTRTVQEKGDIVDRAKKEVQCAVAESIRRLKPSASHIGSHRVSRLLRILQRHTHDHGWKEALLTYRQLKRKEPGFVMSLNGGMYTMFLDPPDKKIDAYAHLAAELCAMIHTLANTQSDQHFITQTDSSVRGDTDTTDRFRGFFEPPLRKPSAQASMWRSHVGA